MLGYKMDSLKTSSDSYWNMYIFCNVFWLIIVLRQTGWRQYHGPYICWTWSWPRPVCNFTKVLIHQYPEWNVLKLIMCSVSLNINGFQIWLIIIIVIALMACFALLARRAQNAQHLISDLIVTYELTRDWTRSVTKFIQVCVGKWALIPTLLYKTILYIIEIEHFSSSGSVWLKYLQYYVKKSECQLDWPQLT